MVLMEDSNEAYNDFIEEYCGIYNTCFPLKVLKDKQVNKFFSPWLSPVLMFLFQLELQIRFPGWYTRMR